MKDKMEVGEYVRTNKGNIGQVIGIFNGHCQAKYHIQFQGKVKVKRQYLSTHTIIKHSKQLIDLIENKDVLKIRIDKTIMVIGIDEDTSDIKYKELIENIKNGEYELLEILTHEQFEANCYKVGELYERN